MKLRVKQKFLSYEIGDELPISLLVSDVKYFTRQVSNGNLEIVSEVINASKLEDNQSNDLEYIIPKKGSKSIISRAKDYIEDLLDDGKRNHSNNPNKKSPGRKKKIIKKK